GASFNMWQAVDSIGSYLTREPGTLLWNELQTDDLDAAADFYADVFGWKTQVSEMENGPYTTFLLGEAAVAGMMEIQPEWGPVPPNWSIYLEVENTDEAVETVKKLGGKQEMPVMEVPEAGRFALIQDPQGAYLYVMQVPRD
nr:VOC family protein [Acidimicrobiia bacterium]